MSITILRTRAVSAGLAAALALGTAAPGFAAPVLTNTAALKAAASGDLIDVRWRGGGIAAGVIGGIAAGAIIGGALARPYYGPTYYGGGYYADPYGPPAPYYMPPPEVFVTPSVYPPPAYAPAYGPRLDPSIQSRRCYVQNDDRGYGYWRAC